MMLVSMMKTPSKRGPGGSTSSSPPPIPPRNSESSASSSSPAVPPRPQVVSMVPKPKFNRPLPPLPEVREESEDDTFPIIYRRPSDKSVSFRFPLPHNEVDSEEKSNTSSSNALYSMPQNEASASCRTTVKEWEGRTRNWQMWNIWDSLIMSQLHLFQEGKPHNDPKNDHIIIGTTMEKTMEIIEGVFKRVAMEHDYNRVLDTGLTMLLTTQQNMDRAYNLNSQTLEMEVQEIHFETRGLPLGPSLRRNQKEQITSLQACGSLAQILAAVLEPLDVLLIIGGYLCKLKAAPSPGGLRCYLNLHGAQETNIIRIPRRAGALEPDFICLVEEIKPVDHDNRYKFTYKSFRFGVTREVTRHRKFSYEKFYDEMAATRQILTMPIWRGADPRIMCEFLVDSGRVEMPGNMPSSSRSQGPVYYESSSSSSPSLLASSNEDNVGNGRSGGNESRSSSYSAATGATVQRNTALVVSENRAQINQNDFMEQPPQRDSQVKLRTRRIRVKMCQHNNHFKIGADTTIYIILLALIPLVIITIFAMWQNSAMLQSAKEERPAAEYIYEQTIINNNNNHQGFHMNEMGGRKKGYQFTYSRSSTRKIKMNQNQKANKRENSKEAESEYGTFSSWIMFAIEWVNENYGLFSLLEKYHSSEE